MEKTNNDLMKWNVRTDLAYDECIQYRDQQLPDFHEEEGKINDVKVIKHIIGQQASSILHKSPGQYYTLDLTNTDFHDATICENIEKALAAVLVEILEQKQLLRKRCLLVGLGNINVTPDALGPYVIDNVIVTRHLFELGSVSDGFSEVSALSPGVMGTTGIETFDIIKAVKDKIAVDYLIVIDALASNSIARVNKTIQITDTGIRPGSGVGNKRKELSIATMGVPVIAIGVPTVVDAVTITSEAIDYVMKYLQQGIDGKENAANKITMTPVAVAYDKLPEPNKDTKEVLMGKVGLLDDEEKRTLIQEVLTPNGYNMMVTPKEVDADIEDLSKIIATGIDLAIHPGLLTGHTE